MYDLRTIVKMNEDLTWKDKNTSQKDHAENVKKDILQRASMADGKLVELKTSEVVAALLLQTEGKGKLSVSSDFTSYFSVKGFEEVSLDKTYKTANGCAVRLFAILDEEEICLSDFPVFGVYGDYGVPWTAEQWSLTGEAYGNRGVADLVEVK